MGVKKIMDTFFASMQEQTMAGYGGKLVNTPMGPFRWNDTMQLWENVNNGMVMNNISFQDSIMMLDYSSTDGGFDIRNIPVVPGGDPTLVLYLNFAASAIGPVTYSRGGTASYIDSDKLVKFVAPNTPRFSYYPLGTTNGLLVEQGTTNILERSEAFNNSSSWTATGISLSQSNLGNDPSGTTSQLLIYPDVPTTNSTRRIISNQYTFIVGATYTVSVWAKPMGHTFNRYFGLTVTNSNARSSLDIIGVTTQNQTTNEYSRIIPYNDGWYRGEMTFVAANTPAEVWISVLSSMEDPITQYPIPSGNTSGIMFWGAQLEQNTSASSYIRTTGATATRGNDLAHLVGTGFTWFNGNCGTFVFEFDKKTVGHTADNIKARTVMGMNYDSSNNYGIALDYIIGSTVASIRTANGYMLLNNSGLTNGMNKVSFSYNNNGLQMEVVSSVNGSTTQSQSPDISDFNISGATFMTLGYKQALVGTTAYDYLDTTIRSVQYWNKALSGASLQHLSS
jgi:hypothetical protein